LFLGGWARYHLLGCRSIPVWKSIPYISVTGFGNHQRTLPSIKFQSLLTDSFDAFDSHDPVSPILFPLFSKWLSNLCVELSEVLTSTGLL
jgi:hypothetical protein